MFRNLLIQMKPSNFADITALALGRPGPLDSGMDQVYIRNKHGYSRIEYPHEDLEEIMSDTHGIFLYQEQLMLTCMKLAGFSALEADSMRRPLAKSVRTSLEIGQQFVSRAVERGYDARMLEDLWHNMATFGQYGFNRSHSAAYAMLTYQTAWLKVHYPLYFYTSVLTNESNSNAKDATEKVKTAIAEAKKRGIKFLQPDINKSEGGFSVEDGAIRFGLVAIKGVGYKAMDAIQEARRSKEFTSMADFLERVDVRVCNKRVISCLVLAGAFDSLNPNRLEC